MVGGITIGRVSTASSTSRPGKRSRAIANPMPTPRMTFNAVAQPATLSVRTSATHAPSIRLRELASGFAEAVFREHSLRRRRLQVLDELAGHRCVRAVGDGRHGIKD